MSHSKRGAPSAPVRASALKWKKPQNERQRQFHLLTRVRGNGSKSSHSIKMGSHPDVSSYHSAKARGAFEAKISGCSIAGGFANRSSAFAKRAFATSPPRCALRPFSSGNVSKMPNFDGPIFNAYQVVVPVSACTNGSADFRNCSTSCSLPGFASSCTRIENLSMFSPGTQLFRSADGQLLLIQRHENFNCAGSVQIANALLIELLSSSKYQSLPDSRLVLPPDCYVRAACSDFVSNVNTSGRE